MNCGRKTCALIFLFSKKRRKWFQDSCVLGYTERKTQIEQEKDQGLQ